MSLLAGADGAVLLGRDGAALHDGLPGSDFDYTQTILSQYANSPVITGLVAACDAAIDPAPMIVSFFDAVWNIDTAAGYGLDRWGRVVGVGRVLALPEQRYFFGFAEAADGANQVPFNQAPFWSGVAATTANYAMTDQMYRRVILAKAMANVCNGSIPAINQILQILFPNSPGAWCTDGTMTMSYTFAWSLSVVEIAVVTQSGVLPKTAGVTLSIVQG